jgi:aspartate dehydrogenase
MPIGRQRVPDHLPLPFVVILNGWQSDRFGAANLIRLPHKRGRFHYSPGAGYDAASITAAPNDISRSRARALTKRHEDRHRRIGDDRARGRARLVETETGLTLDCVAAGDDDKAQRYLAEAGWDVPVVSLAEMARRVDVVVDCAPSAAFRAIGEAVAANGRILLTVSGAALLESFDLVDRVAEGGGRVILATGALLGLDAVRAAALGTVHSVTMVTRKPPKSLVKAEHVVRNGIDLTSLDGPLKIFEGSAREGAAAFPANVNVAAALGLAGVGPDRTRLEIWADPALERNTHFITVDSDSARFELRIENIPTDENPGTGRITALSVVAALRALVAPLHVGT